MKNRTKATETRFVALRGKMPPSFRCVPCDTAHFVVLVWRKEIVDQHTQFGCQEISSTEDMKYIKIQ